MLKFCIEKWNANKDKLKAHIENNFNTFNECGYLYLVESVVTHIFNDENDYLEFDARKITEIDNGDYQGTLLYLIPQKTYQPSETEYLMTYVGYGSCSGCDTLQSIQMWGWYNDDEEPENSTKSKFVNDVMSLCLHIVQNTIKPYNYGWREDNRFAVVEIKQNDIDTMHQE